MILAFLLLAITPSPDSVNTSYLQHDVEELRAVLDTTTDRSMRLLCLYRLYPLTHEEELLEEIPTDLEEGSAADYAILSGLWGYRTGEAGFPSVITYGRRSSRLLDQAEALDPEAPFVLLVKAQSLLFRPAIFGGDKEQALEILQGLHQRLAASEHPAIVSEEAEVWIWYALTKLDPDRADRMRAELMRRSLPPVLEEFVRSMENFAS